RNTDSSPARGSGYARAADARGTAYATAACAGTIAPPVPGLLPFRPQARFRSRRSPAPRAEAPSGPGAAPSVLIECRKAGGVAFRSQLEVADQRFRTREIRLRIGRFGAG